MKKVLRQLSALREYFLYFVKAKHRKGHGIHSPFIYHLVSKVIYDKTKYADYSFFRSIRKKMYGSDVKLRVEQVGANSRHFKLNLRTVADLAKVSSVQSKFGNLLYRLVMQYKPATIIELGTSIGLSTIYLAKGNKNSHVITVEANSSLCDFAKSSFQENKLYNISVKQGMFDDLLDELSNKITKPAFIFIDGNHTYESTLYYFNYFADRMEEGIIVLDDIHWSEGMHKAWNEIIQNDENQATVDLFSMGIVVCREQITPRNYTVRF